MGRGVAYDPLPPPTVIGTCKQSYDTGYRMKVTRAGDNLYLLLLTYACTP